MLSSRSKLIKNLYSGKSISKVMFFLIIFFFWKVKIVDDIWIKLGNISIILLREKRWRIQPSRKHVQCLKTGETILLLGGLQFVWYVEWNMISIAFWNQILQKVNHSQKSVFHHMWKVIGNIDRFYTLWREWGQEGVKTKGKKW